MAIAVLAVIFATLAFVGQEWRKWNAQAAVGRAADLRFKALFSERGWNGHAAAFHYDGRVRIESPDIGDRELRELDAILAEIVWLRHIELFDTRVTSAGETDLHRKYPDCNIERR